jgi:uncharacterized protein involved in exopolysaccharide biosynthesis
MAMVGDFGRLIGYMVRCAIRRWYVVLATMIIVVLGGVGFARLAQPQYSSSMIIVPAQTNQLSGLGGARSAQLASFTSSLSAFGLGGLGAQQQFLTYIEVLQSPSVAAAVLADPQMLSELYEGATDPKTGQFVRRPGAMSTSLYGLFKLAPPTAPSLDDVQHKLNITIIVNTSSENPNIATIVCTAHNPYFCPKFLHFVDSAAQTQLSAVTLNDAQRMVGYINAQLPQVQQQEVRDALSDLLTSAIKQVAVSQLHQSQGAVIVSQPFASDQPSFPKPRFIIQVTIMLGLVLGVFLAWFFTQTEFDVKFGRSMMALAGQRKLPT